MAVITDKQLGELKPVDLIDFSSDDKDDIIIRLCSKLKSCQNHRGNRIDVAEFERWESEISKERTLVASLRREISELKSELAVSPPTPLMKKDSPPNLPASPLFPKPIITSESSSQTEATDNKQTIVVLSTSSQTMVNKTVEGSCQTEDSIQPIVETREIGIQTQERPQEKGKEVTKRKTQFTIPELSDADTAIVFEELTSLHCVFRDIMGGGSDLDNVWEHTCSCGFFAALTSLRRRGKECTTQVTTMRNMISQKLRQAKRAKEKKQEKDSASEERGGSHLPSVLKKKPTQPLMGKKERKASSSSIK